MKNENGTYFLSRQNKKATRGATYKQFKLMESLENVDVTINASQFMKYIMAGEASEAIELALSGENVVVD